MDIAKLTDQIIAGRQLNKNDDLNDFITVDLEKFSQGADKLRKAFVGNKVDLCTIINGKSGKCGENCKFCAQSAHNHTNCDVYSLLDYESIYKEAKSNQDEGVDRFAIVTSGKSPSEEDFEKLLEIYRKLHKELSISLCASLGFLTEEQFNRLYDAGVRSYHNNIETSKNYFPQICTTHTFEDKIANIKRAQKAGLFVCSGGIIGMGETFNDRIDMALTLAELGIKSIPINALIPIPNTPLGNLKSLSEEEILRTVAIFRFINPEAHIRIAAGRLLVGNNGKALFEKGASATITGNMLTTTGSTIQSDRAMFKSMGREII